MKYGERHPLAGMSLHRDSRGRVIPILPRADPDAPRAQPKFRVGGDLDQHGTYTNRLKLQGFFRLASCNLANWVRSRVVSEHDSPKMAAWLGNTLYNMYLLRWNCAVHTYIDGLFTTKSKCVSLYLRARQAEANEKADAFFEFGYLNR